MAKRIAPKKEKDCEEIEELNKKIGIIDERDKTQYDTAKKIIQDSFQVVESRISTTEHMVSQVKIELEEIYESRKQMTAQIISSFDALQARFESLRSKLDNQIEDETEEFKDIKHRLEDIATHGTSLARRIDDQLNHVKVNGGSYPLSEALQHIYDQHIQTHKKLDDVVALVGPIQARKRWYFATKELIKKNGLMYFFFTTKVGIIS